MYVQIYYPKYACVARWGSRKTFLTLKKRSQTEQQYLSSFKERTLGVRPVLLCVRLGVLQNEDEDGCSGSIFTESLSDTTLWILTSKFYFVLIVYRVAGISIKCCHVEEEGPPPFAMSESTQACCQSVWYGLPLSKEWSGYQVNRDATIAKSQEEALTLNNGHEKTRHSTLLFLSEPFTAKVCNLKSSHTHLQLRGEGGLLWRLEDTNLKRG